MAALWLLSLVVLVVQSTADITGTNPATGSCLCASGSGINVRSSACGDAISQVTSGRCFEYQGSKSTCALDGVNCEFFKLEYDSGSGWVAGKFLVTGSSSLCDSAPSDGCPRIVSRSEWGARKPRSTAAIGRPVSKVIIHHTASPTCTTQSDCARLVRIFQNDHMDNPKKKWSDIGYNFLVGQDGNVYEGRGWDVVGAHARGWNSKSIGISVIGSFTKSVPNAAALNAVKQLIACGVSKGKLSASYTLHGHRDGGCTSCPGDAFYNLINKWPKYGGALKPRVC